MSNKIWVRLLTKAPVGLPNDAKELFEYYCKQKGLTKFPLPYKCHCSQKEVSDIVAAFAVNANSGNRSLYIVPISLDYLKKRIKEPENPVTFQVPLEDLVYISKYEPLSNFVDLSINES
ncbi:MAG: hypothetical protein PEPC_01930 [Peptostreptococcus russellii]